jgi:t-SNARE complex subunit (syntaxin)
MNKSPKKPPNASSGAKEMAPKIMTKPLPVILDELENYIHRVEEAVKLAQAAAKDSRAAADQARESGEKAAEAARKAAETLPKALVKKVIGSWEFIVILIVIILAAIISAVAISGLYQL